MASETHPRPTFSRLGRWTVAFNVGASVAALLALVVMANYLSARRHGRFPLTLRAQPALSPQTIRVLRSLTNEVKVTVFFNTRDTEDNRAGAELYSLVGHLLGQYTDVNPKVVVETVDPTSQPAKAELVLARYKLTALKNRNFIVIDCEGRTKLIYQNELANYRRETVSVGPPIEFRQELVSFNGEAQLTDALLTLADARQFKIYFTQGHGEHDPDELVKFDGYGKFVSALREKATLNWSKAPLLGTNEIPADCQLLIIAGPRRAFSEEKSAKIERYLRQGGRLFALLSNPARGDRSGLEDLLAKWNVGVGTKAVLDPTQSPSRTGQDLLTQGMNSQHPVMKSLVAESEANRLRLVMPRAVGPLRASSPAPDAPQVTVLATTSAGASDGDVRDGVLYPNPSPSRTGVFSLAVAVEQGSIKDVSPERGAMRMIVVGDALCLDNQLIDEPCGNHYFATLAANWLLDRPQILLERVVARPLQTHRLTMTNQQLQTAEMLLLGGMPGTVLLLGALVWWRRRH